MEKHSFVKAFLDLPSQKQETSVEDKQAPMDTQEKLLPQQVRVGYRTEMSHKERQKWLKKRTYAQTKPILLPVTP